MSTKPKIRWMIRRDTEEVLAIEADSFEYPWSRDDLLRTLRQRNTIAMVATVALDREYVAGFMVYELHKTRLHIVNLAVAADCRRQGIGTAMADKLLAKLSPSRRSVIDLFVRETNLAGQLFWRSLGFWCTGIVANLYEETDEPAYRFEYRLRVPSVAARMISA